MRRPVIAVTGAASGVGLSAVHQLVERDARILAIDVDPDLGERFVNVKTESLICSTADVSRAEDVARSFDLAADSWGHLDGVFNNAAILGPTADLTDYPDDEFDRVLRVNVRGVWLGMKYGIRLLRRSGGGSIVNTSSTGGLRGWPGIAAYIASKHAVVGLTRTAALECAPHGVRVNAVCPGPMDTPMNEPFYLALGDGDVERGRRELGNTVPVGRLANPEEIAATVVWLLLDAPTFLTGAILTVDGAQTAGGYRA